METLDLIDLCSLAETCKRFQETARRIVPKKLTIEALLEENWLVDLNNGSDIICTEEEINRIFKNFGSTLDDVSIPSGTFLDELISQYCCEDYLKRLAIYNRNEAELKHIPYKLQSLCLEFGNVPTDFVLTATDSLECLRLWNVANSHVILQNTFAKLKCFDFTIHKIVPTNSSRRGTVEQSSDHLIEFISRHKCLKTIKFFFDVDDDVTTRSIFQAVVDNCKELETFSISFATDTTVASLQQVQMLRSLKTLTLSFVTFENFELFAPLTELRALHFWYCNLPKDSSHFAVLLRLTELVIVPEYNTRASVNVVSVLAQLRNLIYLELGDEIGIVYNLDEETFLEIIETVKGRPNRLTVKSRTTFDPSKWRGNPFVRLVRKL